MSQRYRDWFQQALCDIKAARDSLEADNYEWAAFQAQQSAEKALKVFLRYHNHKARGHTLVHLLETARNLVAVPEELWPQAREFAR